MKYLSKICFIIFLILLFILCCTIDNKVVLFNNISQYLYDTDYKEISFNYSANVYIFSTDEGKKQNIYKAFEKWKEATAGTIIFNEVEDIAKSNITIKYVDKLSKKSKKTTIGTNATIISEFYNNNRIESEYKNDIEILNDEESVQVIVHELGHAIGLIEHSELPISIMNANKGFRAILSDEDVLRAKLLPLSKKGNDKEVFSQYYSFVKNRRYYINSCDERDYDLQECNLAKSAFVVWQNMGNIKNANLNIHTSNYNLSDLDVNFVDMIDEGRQLGHIFYEVINGQLYITIEVARRGILPDDETKTIVTLTKGQKKAILIHEIGHACGIFDSEDKNSIMYPYGDLNIRAKIHL